MRLVLDASVAVAAARPGEPSHGAARARLSRILRRLAEIGGPTPFSVGVGGGGARGGESRSPLHARPGGCQARRRGVCRPRSLTIRRTRPVPWQRTILCAKLAAIGRPAHHVTYTFDE